MEFTNNGPRERLPSQEGVYEKVSPEPASRGEETFQVTLYGLTNAFVFFDHMCTATTDMFQNYVGDEMKYSTAWKEPDERKRGK